MPFWVHVSTLKPARPEARTAQASIGASDTYSSGTVGDADLVAYEAIEIRHNLVMLTWREHIGSTVVHVLDFDAATAYTAVTPARGPFMRLTGAIKPVSLTP